MTSRDLDILQNSIDRLQAPQPTLCSVAKVLADMIELLNPELKRVTSTHLVHNKRTREQFIEKANNKYGIGRFNYSKVSYVTCKDNVIIICTIEGHGKFETTPDCHLAKKSQGGCPTCRYLTIASKTKKSQSQFIKEANLKHNNKYDYSQVIYKNHTSTVKIICKDHGVFEQKAGNHLRGDGCIKCAGIYSPSTSEWVEIAKAKHGDDKFDYSGVKYINAFTHITIGCKICCKQFKQTPTSHMFSEIGCDWCRKKHLYTTEEYIEEAIKIHGDRFDYSKLVYKSAIESVIIICKIHGEFLQTPSDHKNQGSGCKKCSNVYSPSTEEWIMCAIKLWGNEYDYSNVKYESVVKKIIIVCKKHGKFKCSPNNHLHKTNPTGCPSCVRKGEGMVASFLISKKIEFIKEWGSPFLTKRRMDYLLTKLKCCIEIDGLQHFKQVWNWKSPEEQRINDIDKMKLCVLNGYSVIRIFQPSMSICDDSWKSFILNCIDFLTENKTPIIIYPENELYEQHIKLCNEQSLNCVVR